MATFNHLPRGSVVGSGSYVFRHYGQESAPMPVKGQIITMTLGNDAPVAGTQNTYRVLSIDGTIAFVVAMFDQKTNQKFGSNNTYNGSALDVYLNTTWYNTLSETAKSAIQSTTIAQYEYLYRDSVYNASTHASPADYSTKTIIETFERKVYALDVDDIETYFNNRFGNTDIWTMFWNTSSRPYFQTYPNLRSAKTGGTTDVWNVNGYGGYITYSSFTNANAARPAFRIDLSKITWS